MHHASHIAYKARSHGELGKLELQQARLLSKASRPSAAHASRERPAGPWLHEAAEDGIYHELTASAGFIEVVAEMKHSNLDGFEYTH